LAFSSLEFYADSKYLGPTSEKLGKRQRVIKPFVMDY